MKRVVLLLVIALFAGACAADDGGSVSTTSTTSTGATTTSTTSATTTSLPGPERIRAAAFVESVELVLLESYPVQVRALVTGSLPTPCHEIDWEVGDLRNGRIPVEVFSWTTDAPCIQVIEPFEVMIPVGDFETGSYEVLIAGESYPFDV